ncbi:MAG: hypothetical protein AB2L14_23265 [Candidatus Xenobiia bacterium LiM19]
MSMMRLFVDDKVELCDGHSDYGYSILYCEADDETVEIYRTRYETNRSGEQTEGISSCSLDKSEMEWIATVTLVDGTKKTFNSRDGLRWR